MALARHFETDQAPSDQSIGPVTSDGACGTRKCHYAKAARGLLAVAPPARTQNHGSPKAPVPSPETWRYGCHVIWVGRFDRQVAEIQARIAALNRCKALGRPVAKRKGSVRPGKGSAFAPRFVQQSLSASSNFPLGTPDTTAICPALAVFPRPAPKPRHLSRRRAPRGLWRREPLRIFTGQPKRRCRPPPPDTVTSRSAAVSSGDPERASPPRCGG